MPSRFSKACVASTNAMKGMIGRKAWWKKKKSTASDPTEAPEKASPKVEHAPPAKLEEPISEPVPVQTTETAAPAETLPAESTPTEVAKAAEPEKEGPKLTFRESVDGFLEEISAAVGKNIRLNDQGISAFTYEHLTIVIEVPESVGSFFLYTSLLSFTGVPDIEGLMDKCLRLNYLQQETRGGCLSKDPINGELMFSYTDRITEINSTDFRNILENFIDTALNLGKEVGQFSAIKPAFQPSEGGKVSLALAGEDVVDEERKEELSEETREFLTNLHEYRSCRTQMEEINKKVDPDGILANCIETFNKSVAKGPNQRDAAFQQQKEGGEPVQTIEEAYEAAALGRASLLRSVAKLREKWNTSKVVSYFKPPAHAVAALEGLPEKFHQATPEGYQKFGEAAKQAVEDIQGSRLTNMEAGPVIMIPPQKGIERCIEKAKDDYKHMKPGPGVSWLFDINRVSLVCSCTKQILDILEWLKENTTLVVAKNKFKHPTFNGYRDFLFVAQIQVEGRTSTFNHCCEIQLHHCDTWLLNQEVKSHKYYEYFRTYFSGSGEVGQRMKDLDEITKRGRLDDKFIKEIIESGDVGRMERMAEIFSKKLVELGYSARLWEEVLKRHLESSDSSNLEESVRIMNKLGAVLQQKGATSRSLDLHQEALAICKKLHGEEHADTAECWHYIGQARFGQGDHDESMSCHEKALAIRKRVKGEKSKETADSYTNIGVIYHAYTDYDKSMEMIKKSLEIREELVGRNHESTASSYSDIGALLQCKNDLEGSLEWHFKALEVRENTLGKGHVDVAFSHEQIGHCLSRQGKYEEALKRHQKALEMRETSLGRTHPQTANSYVAIGGIMRDQKQYDISLQYLRRAMKIRELVYPADHPEIAAANFEIGVCMHNKDGAVAAYPYIQRAVQIAQKKYKNPDNQILAQYKNWLQGLGDMIAENQAAAASG